MAASAPATSRSALVIIYLTVFIDLLGFGIILPVLPFYARQFGASGLWIGILMMAYSAAQFLGAPIVGRLSDRYGRRPVILITLAGSALSLTVTGFATQLGVLILARALAGFFGGSIAAAQAFVADVTLPEQRAKYMGLLGASIGMGFVFGPAIGAALSPYGLGAAAFAAAGLATLNLIFAAFRLPETRNAQAKPRHRLALLPALAAALRAQGALRAVLGALFATTFAFVAMETTFALFGAEHFELTPRGLGFIFTLLGVIVVIVQGGLVGRLSKRVGERRLASTGLLLMAAGLVFTPFGPTLTAAVIALGALAAGQALAMPSLTTLLSRLVGADEQGEMLGVGQSFQALARGLSPLAAGALYDLDFHAPYLLGAVVCTLAVLLLLVTGRQLVTEELNSHA